MRKARNVLAVLSILAVALILAVAVAAPATAAIFTVTLVNDTSFISRYQPMVDPNNENKILLLTEMGNWIALPREIVSDISSESESAGFGLVIDSQTIEVGISANDAPIPGEEEPLDPTAQMLQLMQERQNQAPYTLDQFVEPEDSGGIPIGWANTVTPPLGGVGVYSRPRRR